jgi:hypothetical protein
VSVDGGKFTRRSGVTTLIGIKDKSKALSIWQQQLTADFLFGLLAKKIKINEEKVVEAIIQCDIKRDEAADIGKEIHSWCEKYIRHKLGEKGFESVPDIPSFPEAVIGVNAFLQWEKEHKVKFVSTEKVVYSLKENFIGIEDVTFIADGLFCDADFKSSNGLYNGVRLQTAAYAYARMEDGGRKSQGRWAIRLSKYSEEEYYKRERRKKEIKQIIAKIQGNEFKDYEIKPYQVFEPKFLDNEKGHLERDYKAFLNFKAGFEWDKETDPYYNGDNW